MEKKQWEKPELIVLMRNHPEETLQQLKCKNPNVTIGFNNVANASCAENAGDLDQCFNSSDPS